MDDVPDWARERATQLMSEVRDANPLGALWFSYRTAFAHYIAAHEEPPVDPLLVEARKIAARARQSNWANVSAPLHDDVALKIADGEWDDHMLVVGALAALRRGIELAKVQP